MAKKGRVLTHDECVARIREVRPAFEAKVGSGEIVVRKNVTYDRKGPSIKGGPHGWRPKRNEETSDAG